MFEPSAATIDHNATVAPKAATTAPKANRSRAKLARRLDQRTAQYRRIVELAAIFTDALGGLGAIAPMKRLKVAEAAELKAIAEAARSIYLRDGAGTLDDLVRIERKADHAVRALGIVEAAPRPPSLRDYITAKHGAGSDNEAVADNGADQDAEPPA